MRYLAIPVLVLALVACSRPPNLDEAVPGQSPATVRSAIAGHLGWGDKLTAQQLDDLVTFLSTYASSNATPPPTDAGLKVWRANDCARCHQLAAGGTAPPS